MCELPHENAKFEFDKPRKLKNQNPNRAKPRAQVAKRQKMQLTFKQRAQVFFLKWLALGLMHLLRFTCRVRYDGQGRSGEPCVVLCWHGKVGFTQLCFKHYWRGRATKTIISEHFDGELITQISAFFGVGAIRGSSTRGGVRALAESLRELRRGTDVAITPDGPRGPYHSVSDGSVQIAQKSGVRLVFVTFTASRFWRLKSWDRMMIPKPFSTITFRMGEPFSIAGLEMDAAKAEILRQMAED